MLRSDVVDYLRENLPKHPVEALRNQLYEEGVSDVDFEQSLAEALLNPKKETPPQKKKPQSAAVKYLLLCVLILIVGAALFFLLQKPAAAPSSEPAAQAESGESGYVGAHGWVVRLPKDYQGVSEFKDASKNDEIVHFAKRGTDPTSFLDDGLYGELGIVRLEVAPNPFPPNQAGALGLANTAARKTTAHGEKFLMKKIQIGTLPGVQLNVQSPFPRVEAYVLGQNDLYFFYGGQDDDIWRDILLSLRDAHSEN